jgi:hypothetical protein
VAATIVAATISGVATYSSRPSDVHAPIGSASSPVSSQLSAPGLPVTSSPPAQSASVYHDGTPNPPGSSDGSAIDIIGRDNTTFDSAIKIDLRKAYESRFSNNGSSLFFNFNQQDGDHDLKSEFKL